MKSSSRAVATVALAGIEHAATSKRTNARALPTMPLEERTSSFVFVP